MDTTDKITILLVEDDPGHALLIQKNLKRGGVSGEIIALENGKKAVDFLLRQGEFAADPRPRPQLMLLDLNLPILDGYQVLKIVKGDDRLRQLPIIVLTTTDNPNEANRCYDLGCNAYVTKPVNYEQFSSTMQGLGSFLSMIRIPRKGAE